MLQAPPVDHFPLWPASWYLFCASRELRDRPLAREMLGRRLVAYRTNSGKLALLEASCSHLGADLGRGCVVGEAIRCPFHHWRYGPDGACVEVPTQETVPAFARQASFPVVERHGWVFFFNGPQPLFPLPFFWDCEPQDFVAGRPFQFTVNCPWYMLVGHGFDAEHLGAVHDRTLVGPPTIDRPSPFALRMRYSSRVTGDSLFDRLLRQFVGEAVKVSITNWGGPLVLITANFRGADSFILMATRPLEKEKTLAEILIFVRRSRRLGTTLVQPINLQIRRLFTRAFLNDDIDRVGTIRYSPGTLIESDRLLIEFFQWAAALPSGPHAPSANGHAPRKTPLVASADCR